MVSRFNARLLAIAAVLMFATPVVAFAGGTEPSAEAPAKAKKKKMKKAKKTQAAKPVAAAPQKKNWAAKHPVLSQSGPSPVVINR